MADPRPRFCRDGTSFFHFHTLKHRSGTSAQRIPMRLAPFLSRANGKIFTSATSFKVAFAGSSARFPTKSERRAENADS